MKQQTETSRLDHRKQIFAPTILVLLALGALWPLKTYILTPAADRIAPQTVQADRAAAQAGTPNRVTPAHSRIPASGSPAGEMQLMKSYGKLTLSFEPNRGQADSRVKFLSRRSGYTLFLTSTEAVLGLSKANASVAPKHGPVRTRLEASLTSSHRAASLGRTGLLPASRAQLFRSPAAELSSNSTLPGLDETTRAEAQASLRMRLVGANPAPRLIALDELPGKSNYFIGRDRTKWRTKVPNYAKVKYQDVYPGVDLVYYGNEGRLEYDFVVAGGADPRAIKLDISGAKGEKIDNRGDLVLDMGNGEIRFHKPMVYQPVAALSEGQGGKNFLDGRFVLSGNSQAGFEVAAYDATKPLVIDPVLTYSTYLGGSGDDFASPTGVQGIAVDPEGNAYMIGVTNSTDFPVTAGAFQTKFGGASDTFISGDAFVTKLNARGDALVYSTYLGGTSDDSGEGIAVDSQGNAYIAGETLSTDFPITKGVFQPACASCANGAPDNFAAKLSPDGSALVYSTYIGGSDADLFPMIAIDRFGNMYIEGTTWSTDFPVTKGAFEPACASCANGNPDTYVTKLNPSGTALVYSTYLGGNDFDVCGAQIAVDFGGNVYVNGLTHSTDFPVTPRAFQRTLTSSICGTPPDTFPCPDGFITKLNAAGTALVYSSYLGGSGVDFVFGTAIDSAGNAYLTGFTDSSDFPVMPGALQPAFAGGTCLDNPNARCFDAFVTKINPAGSGLVYSTYLGGTGDDKGSGMAVDAHGNAYVGGNTSSVDFPTLTAFQPANAGGYDIFVAELNATGNALVYSTYLGGSSDEFTNGIALDHNRNVYVQGSTPSTDFLVANPMQPQFGGGNSDALLAKISPMDAPGLGLSRLSVNFGAQATGTTSAPQVLTVRNVGSQTLVIHNIQAEPEFAQTNTCTSPLAPYESCIISITFTPTGEGEAQGELVVVANSQPASRRVSLTGGQAAAQAPKPNGPTEKRRTPGTIPNWRKTVMERRGAAH